MSYTELAAIRTPRGTLHLSKATADPDWYLIQYETIRDEYGTPVEVLDVSVEDAKHCQGYLDPGEWAFFGGRGDVANLRPAALSKQADHTWEPFTLHPSLLIPEEAIVEPKGIATACLWGCLDGKRLEAAFAVNTDAEEYARNRGLKIHPVELKWGRH